MMIEVLRAEEIVMKVVGYFMEKLNKRVNYLSKNVNTIQDSFQNGKKISEHCQ